MILIARYSQLTYVSFSCFFLFTDSIPSVSSVPSMFLLKEDFQIAWLHFVSSFHYFSTTLLPQRNRCLLSLFLLSWKQRFLFNLLEPLFVVGVLDKDIKERTIRMQVVVPNIYLLWKKNVSHSLLSYPNSLHKSN